MRNLPVSEARHRHLLLAVIVGAFVSGCAAQRPLDDTALFLDGDRLHTGATISGAGGTVSGGSTERKER